MLVPFLPTEHRTGKTFSHSPPERPLPTLNVLSGGGWWLSYDTTFSLPEARSPRF